jgi:hypothetical protein
MAEAASAQRAATASHEETSPQRAGRRRRTSAEPKRAQQGATAAAAAATAAQDNLSRLQQLADASPQVAQLQRLQALADASPQVAQLRRLQALADAYYAPVTQLAGGPEEEEPVQGQFATAEVQPQLQQAPRVNNTGLPDQLKSGIESLSGLSMDHVRVHYNSSQPAQLNALAYAQGSDIHLAPGQERHLPHEAWHVVQQAQGRVRSTLQTMGVNVNDDSGLEYEADVMGTKAAQMRSAAEDTAGQGRLVEPARVVSSLLAQASDGADHGLGTGSEGLAKAAPPVQRSPLSEHSAGQARPESRQPGHAFPPPGARAASTHGDSFQLRQVHHRVQPGVVQRRDMRAVMIDQHAREKKVNAKSQERYTTVGFEWDIAQLTEHSQLTPNVLQGLTHVELAESTQKWNGLPYFLETDAGNVLEFITPPFYVKTAGPETTLPDITDLNDIIDSTRESLAGVATPSHTLRTVIVADEWNRFALGAWTPNQLKVDWHNWSPRAQTQQGIQQGLGAWHDITVAQSTLGKGPQINIAVRPIDYASAQASGESRLGKKDDYVEEVLRIEKKLRDYVVNRAMKAQFKDEAQSGRIRLVVDQAVRVMAQQPIVPLIQELAEQQRHGYAGQDVANAFARVSGAPSYIKDTGVVWLKTDLFSYAASVLKGGEDDWAVLAGSKGLLETMKRDLQKTELGKSGVAKKSPIDKAPMSTVLVRLQASATELANVEGVDEKSRGSNRNAYILDLLRKIGAERPAFNEHADTILGVRQDTFINPITMVKLSQRLQLGGMLSVMEVRNTNQFLSWLGSEGRQSKNPQKGEDLQEMPPAAIEGASLFPNVTVGDGNCFFHALHESRHSTRSSTELQGQIRRVAVDALSQRNDICTSHFGPRGKESAEFQHFALKMLEEGAWISDQTPAIVSDALNMRICIHNTDGSIYFDAVPNNAFHHPQPMVTVHVMYTGNHYNSYTNPALQ